MLTAGQLLLSLFTPVLCSPRTLASTTSLEVNPLPSHSPPMEIVLDREDPGNSAGVKDSGLGTSEGKSLSHGFAP